jgi:hypothetical protein
VGGVKPDWLDQLAAAHAPPPPGWWPPAPGWWGLALLLIGAAVLLALWLRSPTRRLRRAALLQLQQLERGAADDAALARGLEHLLRRYAVARFGREPVARLSGEPWLAFLAAHGGAALAGAPGQALLRSAYGGGGAADRDSWLSGARGFLRGPRRRPRLPWRKARA